MSLFKIRDFWNFDLNGLQLEAPDSSGSDSFLDPDDSCKEATFTASIGRFNSIGQQDVFVCGNLQGSIFIVQVPVADQRKYIKRATTNEGTIESPEDGSGSAKSYGFIDDRQLLAATSMKMPIVDIKCGYFVSAIKQSIAALSFDKLLIFQVKRHEPVDLITDSEFNFQGLGGEKVIIPSQLSHEFEEHVRLDLLSNEFACCLVVLNSHADSNLRDVIHKDTIKEASLDLETRRKSRQESNKFIKQSKLTVQQLHLPQRDKLIVQYVNQFLFTLVDGKKINGHFSLTHSHQENSEDGSDTKAVPISQSLGCMPMAYLHCSKATSSIVLSFSDYKIRCVPIEKLVSQARHEVMRRVASNLLHNGESSAELPSSNKTSSSLAYASDRVADQTKGLIRVDIDSISEWTHEMLAMPLQMSGELRRAKNISATGHKDELNVSQLLVMSRYSFDLFSACGQHLWSQRFETPLIQSFTYVLELHESDNQEDVITIDGGKLKVQFCDKLINLLCTDSLSAGKSNLIVLEENRIQWSALLNAKPHKIWRLNLTHMPGLLAILDIKQGQLVVSYLGTNSDADERDDNISALKEDFFEAEDVTKLETLDEPLFTDDALSAETSTQQSVQSEQRRRLTFEVSLEASGKWPNVSVDILAAIRLDPQSSGVIHNIVATFEYDDLLRFELSPSDNQSIARLSYPSGVVRVKLGNCWPDRKEPIYLRGSFSLMHSHKRAFGVTAMDELENSPEDLKSNSSLAVVPKSLKVQVFLSYQETHSSLLVQDESFLLPISMISQLTHIDYTNGNGQSIDDVLNNLADYKGATEKCSRPYQVCDLFLQLDLDLVEFLNEFVERDLVCRRTNSIQVKCQEKRNKFEEQTETMENINLLAQSLDCRLRYKNPAGIARQSSEEIIVPAMASFAIRIDQTPSLDVIDNSSENRTTTSNVVWIHICDMNSTNSSLTAEFVMRHTKDWMQFYEKGSPEVGAERSGRGTNNMLVSIECETSWPLMLVLCHMLERSSSIVCFNSQTAVTLINRNDYKAFESVHEAIRYGHHLAISTKLHDSLRDMITSYETKHRDRFIALRDKLAREECKFYIATKAILSLAKRMPSLPENQVVQLMNMSALVKHYQQSISNTLNELNSLKETDFQQSKLPFVPYIKLRRLDRSKGEEVWPRVGRLID